MIKNFKLQISNQQLQLILRNALHNGKVHKPSENYLKLKRLTSNPD